MSVEGRQIEERRTRALELLRRYGRNSTSFQALEPGLRYWLSDDGEACVAYVETGGARVVAGAPIAAPERLAAVTEAFAAEARTEGRRVCCFATERRFVQQSAWPALTIGELPAWDPGRWDETVRSSRSLREQFRRARARGVSVRRVEPAEIERPEQPIRAAIAALVESWIASRRMAPMGFLVQVDLFSFPEEQRIFVAERDGEVLAFLAMVPVYAREGWLLEDLVAARSAPKGTTELLVDAAMRDAAEGGSRFATLGLAPLAGGVSRWLRVLRRAGSRLYNFEGLRAFKAKFRPVRWEPVFLSYPPRQPLPLTVLDALAAFAPEGPARFAWATLLRNPELPLRVLALLLLPWTVLLALAAPAGWFPEPWVRQAWTAFDVALLPALALLSLRWRQRLGAVLALLIGGDALLTLWEVLAYNLPRARAPEDWIVSMIAVLGPGLATAFLWGAWWCRRREPSG